ncbi:MAG: hypothetical protein QOJ42_8208 [Acidobacteriaceae bacterium]|nr:hypothetical protein [Acidobacteriaceae bacterium]
MSAPFSLGRLVPHFRSNGRNGSTPKAGAEFTAPSVAFDTSPEDLTPSILEPTIGASSPEPTEERVPDSGLHGILKSTDYWFNYELSLLEREAKESASSHARAGLPRQDVPVTDELDVEKVLRTKASQLFDQWAERVRRKLHDAVQEVCTSVRRDLGHLRYTAECLEHDANNLKEQEVELLRIQAENITAKPPLEYGSMLGRRTYLVLAALLVLVDWVANVPVFRELLPQEPGSALAWDNLVSGSERWGVLAGSVRLFDRIFFSPDVSILALGVILFLMFLGHVSGTSLRRLVAFRPKDEPSADFKLRSHSRQAMVPLVGSVIGIVLVLGFLFTSRYKLTAVTEKRKAAATQIVDELKAKMERDADNLDAVAQDKRKLADAQIELDERTSSANYASGISEMNWPIFLLNATLVITAAGGAYLESKSRILPNYMGDPRVPSAQESIRALRQRALEGRARIRDLDSNIKANLGRARYLAHSNPFVDWEAKGERLEGLIPLFRSENACLRGLDTSNIRAFDQRKPLDLVPPGQGESFRVPEQMAELEREYNEVRSYMHRVMARTVVSNDGGAL